MEIPTLFTYPFRYTPHPLVAEAAGSLIRLLDSPDAPVPEDALRSLREGKMLGVLITDNGPLYAFSGILAGMSLLDGFVPPILDITSGYFKQREREISALPPGPEKSAASTALQDWLFSNYIVLNARGDQASVKDIFAARGLVPPGGTGECAAPKLLNHAFRTGLKPLAMGEFWYGRSPVREVREQGRFYPSCTGKCGPLLSWMMQGMEVAPNPLDSALDSPLEPKILYSDDAVVVVDKPSGMLSVPGRIGVKSLLEWLRKRFGESVESCHRLDMDTSGLMVYARSVQYKSELERQFASREVRKSYRARLDGGPWNHSLKGTIALPLTLDYYDRPRQMVDYESGKLAVTDYEVLEILPDGSIDVIFWPLTGRSHQIRVHAAHVRGLGHPVRGDRLYGSSSYDGRLWLRACGLCFKHPVSYEPMAFGEGV
ncbi:MAG: RluA family pseudouridine synthase [Bacteroidales bacterium]|nr:RluA family pseudouridine synthase [Bacteroidales bacterium]